MRASSRCGLRRWQGARLGITSRRFVGQSAVVLSAAGSRNSSVGLCQGAAVSMHCSVGSGRGAICHTAILAFGSGWASSLGIVFVADRFMSTSFPLSLQLATLGPILLMGWAENWRSRIPRAAQWLFRVVRSNQACACGCREPQVIPALMDAAGLVDADMKFCEGATARHQAVKKPRGALRGSARQW